MAALTRSVSGTLRGVGARIRLARQRSGMTLAAVGRATGLTPSMLSMVERGVAAPSIGALVAISDVLRISMASLFGSTPASRARARPVVRGREQPVLSTGRGVQRRLILRDTVERLELAENTYHPGAASADVPIHHRGRECGVVLTGWLRVEVGGRVYTLRKGDAIAFNSSLPHRFTNTGKEVARTLWVNVHGNRWSV
ncbi:MAG: cupin domain-containing protein [Armatimonadota bacterium]|nr:cupin domain-containing protein [Armatimonadota bacterium]